MFKIPPTFKSSNKDYIVENSIYRFMKENEIIFKQSYDRGELIRMIEKFANESSENKEKVLEWIDAVILEGIKDIYVKQFKNVKPMNMEQIISKMKSMLIDQNNLHICKEKDIYDKEYVLTRYEVKKNLLRLYYCKKVYVYESKNKSKRVDWYPVIVEIDFDNNMIIGRAKSRTTIYEYGDKEFDVEINEKLSTEYQIKNRMEYSMKLLELEYFNDEINTVEFRKKCYKMLNKYTETPQIIKDKINNRNEQIENVIDNFMLNICEIDEDYKDKVREDIYNLVEKYFSISYKDKSIFTKGRDAYPLRIKATDEDDCTMDQRAAVETPLQSKPIFFDNKRILNKGGMCDEMEFKFYEKGSIERKFTVSMSVKKGFLIVKLRSYTREVDIQNVLQSIINA